MSVGQLPGGNDQDVDLNLAPIIDALVVLISFMLASAAFLSIGFLDAGISAGGASSTSTAKPPITLGIHLQSKHNLEIRVTGKVNKTISISAVGENWGYDRMSQSLQAYRKDFPTVGAVTLSADAQVEYRDVVKTMEALRKIFPGVLLGGF